MFLKQRYYEGGANAMRILAWKLRKKTAENTIHRIRDPRTKVLKSKLKEIQESFKVFYKTLYSRVPRRNVTQIDTFLNSLELPTLNEEQNRRMTADVSEDELKTAISRLKLSKLPGSDGYTAEWFKEFRNELIPVMLPTLNTT